MTEEEIWFHAHKLSKQQRAKIGIYNQMELVNQLKKLGHLKSRDTVRRWLSEGRLPHIKDPRKGKRQYNFFHLETVLRSFDNSVAVLSEHFAKAQNGDQESARNE